MEAFVNNFLFEDSIVCCETCGKPIYEDWRKDKQKRKTPIRFCSRSCANRHEHTEESRKKTSLSLLKSSPEEHYCKNCGKFIGRGKSAEIRIFCSRKCKLDYRNLLFEKWKQGKNVNKEISLKTGNQIGELSGLFKSCIKNFLIEEQKHSCSLCGCSDIHNNLPLVFILDHISGDWSNHLRSNLRLICPNCNSQLETSKSHKGNGRFSTRLYKARQRKLLQELN
jgi:endogenous inhibitor of DNA gyrase (YacG/DUF329 family)